MIQSGVQLWHLQRAHFLQKRGVYTSVCMLQLLYLLVSFPMHTNGTLARTHIHTIYIYKATFHTRCIDGFFALLIHQESNRLPNIKRSTASRDLVEKKNRTQRGEGGKRLRIGIIDRG